MMKNLLKKITNLPKKLYRLFVSFGSFSIILILYVLKSFFYMVFFKFKILPQDTAIAIHKNFLGFYAKACKKLDTHADGTISLNDLIDLSMKNLIVKRTRTLITIGGVSIGFGAIVFLVSIGYGLQELIISRVARLDEMRQTDVYPQTGNRLKIDDKSLADIKGLSDVAEVYPLIAVVGRVNYQNSISDMAVFAVTTGYLQQSAIQPIQGSLFESNDLALKLPTEPQVQGSTINIVDPKPGGFIQPVTVNIYPQQWIRVRSSHSVNAPILGYTRRSDLALSAQEVWGDYYDSDNPDHYVVTETGESFGKWIKGNVPLWQNTTCTTETSGCVDGEYIPLKDGSGNQTFADGYFAQLNMSVLSATNLSNVLGESSVLAESTQSTSSAGITVVEGSDPNFVSIPELMENPEGENMKTIPLASNAVKQAVVNRAALRILDIDETQAVGKKFTSSFIVTSGLLADPNAKVQSEPIEYEIVGVISDDKSPVFYVPFADIRSLGVSSYSQVKVVSDNKEVLGAVRKQVEAMGFVSRSVVDTVQQISGLFNTARFVLGIMGTVALTVAALGMFNTFTVSLLERTREVGLMKVMGMKSTEVQKLFLIESMLMGFSGGIGGIILGFLAGKLLGLALSTLSLTRGAGYLDVTYIPLGFVFLITFLSLIVGICTGIYPSLRARKISALNALRYE